MELALAEQGQGIGRQRLALGLPGGVGELVALGREVETAMHGELAGVLLGETVVRIAPGALLLVVERPRDMGGAG